MHDAQKEPDLSHRTEVLSGKPILLQTCYPDYTSAEIGELWADGQTFLDQVVEPVFYIIDLGAVTISDDSIPSPASLGFRSDRPAFSHPNIREVLPVAQSMTTIIEALGLSTILLGESLGQYFWTPEEALAYCEEQIRAFR